jgi:hypothetical protein
MPVAIIQNGTTAQKSRNWNHNTIEQVVAEQN